MTVWVLIAGSAALLMAVAELGVRWWIRRRSAYYVWLPGLRLDMRQDPDVFPQSERRVRFEVNADGERGGEVPEEGAGVFRILVAGGSAVECFALDQGTSWPGALEGLLNTERGPRIPRRATRVHVGNIGRSGVASRHLDLIFERVLPRYRRLAVIVIMVGASDVLEWLEAGAPASVERSPADVADTFGCHPEQPFGWRPRQWAVVELARRLRRRWLRPVVVKEGVGSWVPAARKMRAQAREVRTSVPDPAHMLGRFDYHFRRLLERAEVHADRVLVVRQPWYEKEYTAAESARFWHGGVGKAWRQTVTIFYAQEVLNRLMGELDARAAAIADELGIEHLDLRGVLAPSLRNYYDAFHSTPAGAGVIARAVAAALLRRTEPARRPRTPVAAPTVSVHASGSTAAVLQGD